MKKLLLLLLALIPQIVLAQTAGDTLGGLSFSVPPEDVSVNLLGNIFGVVPGVLHGTGSQIVGTMFGVFNAAVMALGITILGYTTLAGVLKTAHEGEALGKQWSSVWIPIRSALGIAALAPTQTGYCAFQIFVMWIVVQGVGAADAVWNAALGYLASGGVLVTQSQSASTQGQSQVLTYAAKILSSETCMYGLQNAMNQYRSTAKVDPGQPPVFSAPQVGPISANSVSTASTQYVTFPAQIDTTVYPNYAALNAPITASTDPTVSAGVCGSVYWSPPDFNTVKGALPPGIYPDAQINSMIAGIMQSKNVAVQQMILDMDSVAKMIANNYYNNSSSVALGVLVTPSNDPSKQVWGGPLDPNDPQHMNRLPALLSGREVNDAAADYLGIMYPATHLASEQQTQLAFVTGAMQQGWILAGSYYFNLALLNDNVSSANGAFLTVTPSGALGDFTKAPNKSSPGISDLQLIGIQSVLGNNSDYISNLNALVNGSQPSSLGPWSSISTANNTNYISSATNFTITYGAKPVLPNVSGFQTSGGGILFAILNLFLPFITPIVGIITAMASLATSQNGNNNPIILVAMLGNNMIELVAQIWLGAAGIFTGLAAGLAAIPCFDFSNPVNTFVSWVGPFMMFLSAAMFVSGATMAFYIPMIPYIIFSFAAIGWFIGVIEAMAAAPLVAVGIVHPEGHEVFGKSEPAVMLLANVFLRPMLMIFGLITGIILSYVGVWLINDGFSNAMLIMLSGISGIAGLILVPIAWGILYMSILLALLNKVFSLIYIVPDKVLRWLQGGMQEALGAEAAGAAEAVKGSYTGGMQAGGQAGEKSSEAVGKARREQAKQGGTITPKDDKNIQTGPDSKPPDTSKKT